MILYAESNFVLELTLEQEEQAYAEHILAAAERGHVRSLEMLSRTDVIVLDAHRTTLAGVDLRDRGRITWRLFGAKRELVAFLFLDGGCSNGANC